MKSEITEFVNQTITDIENALPEGYAISEDIRFEINVTKSTNSGGKMDIKILSADNSISNSIVHKIQFEVSPKINDDDRMKDVLKKMETLGSGLYSIVNTFQSLSNSSKNTEISNS